MQFTLLLHTIINIISQFYTFRKTVRKFSKAKKRKLFVTVQFWTLRLLHCWCGVWLPWRGGHTLLLRIMMYNENLHEEEQHLIQQIAEQTERGKIDWELTEYNPLSFLNEDKIDKNPAVICQSFSFGAIIGGSRFELDVMENIDVPSGMGDYTITLTRDETENFLKIEDALSFDYDRYECTPEEVAKRFAGSPIVRLCNAIIPATLGQEDLEEVFTWARFFNEVGISAKLMNHPLTKLCEKLFDEHRLMDFHRCVLDVGSVKIYAQKDLQAPAE